MLIVVRQHYQLVIKYLLGRPELIIDEHLQSIFPINCLLAQLLNLHDPPLCLLAILRLRLNSLTSHLTFLYPIRDLGNLKPHLVQQGLIFKVSLCEKLQ